MGLFSRFLYFAQLEDLSPSFDSGRHARKLGPHMAPCSLLAFGPGWGSVLGRSVVASSRFLGFEGRADLRLMPV